MQLGEYVAICIDNSRPQFGARGWHPPVSDRAAVLALPQPHPQPIRSPSPTVRSYRYEQISRYEQPERPQAQLDELFQEGP